MPGLSQAMLVFREAGGMKCKSPCHVCTMANTLVHESPTACCTLSVYYLFRDDACSTHYALSPSSAHDTPPQCHLYTSSAISFSHPPTGRTALTLRNHHHLQTITHLNMPLRSTRKAIHHQLLHILPRQRLRLLLPQLMPLSTPRHIPILQIHRIVQKRHDQTTRRPSRSAHMALIAAHRVVTIQRALPLLIQPANHRRDVEREEALLIQDMTETLGAGSQTHGFSVLVAVHFHGGVEALF